MLNFNSIFNLINLFANTMRRLIGRIQAILKYIYIKNSF